MDYRALEMLFVSFGVAYDFFRCLVVYLIYCFCCYWWRYVCCDGRDVLGVGLFGIVVLKGKDLGKRV